MSTALAVYHGPFGRAALYLLDRPLATHAHREGHLVFHVSGADSGLTVDGETVPLARISAAAVNPWQPHSFIPGDTHEGSLFLILYIKPMWFLEVGRSARNALRFGRGRIEVGEKINRLVHLVLAMLVEDQASELFDGYLYELTRECFDQSWQWMDGPSRDVAVWPAARDYRIRNAMRLMAERVGDELVLDRIARDTGLSRPHFYKLFRQNIGLTPNLYLNTLRMEYSIARLTTTDEAVTSISLDLGFASQASFTRFFTTNVGIPPSDYRRMAHCVH